jgi:NO-binding membrane sensor protein with MHYT domain
MFLGMLLAGGLAAAVIAVREVFDQSVHSPQELTRLAAAAPLGVIPRIVTEDDRQRSRRRLVIAAATGAVCLILAITLLHFLVMPLDDFWFRAMRRLGV